MQQKKHCRPHKKQTGHRPPWMVDWYNSLLSVKAGGGSSGAIASASTCSTFLCRSNASLQDLHFHRFIVASLRHCHPSIIASSPCLSVCVVACLFDAAADILTIYDLFY
eukprot:scaffold19613_cov69-Skeletonema_dohrnii-CCMP3373.AAC.1